MSAFIHTRLTAFGVRIREATADPVARLAGAIDHFSQSELLRPNSHNAGILPEVRRNIETHDHLVRTSLNRQERPGFPSLAQAIYFCELYFFLNTVFELTLVREQKKLQFQSIYYPGQKTMIDDSRAEARETAERIFMLFRMYAPWAIKAVGGSDLSQEYGIVGRAAQSLEGTLALWGDVTREALSRNPHPAFQEALKKAGDFYDLLDGLKVPVSFSTNRENAALLKATS